MRRRSIVLVPVVAALVGAGLAPSGPAQAEPDGLMPSAPNPEGNLVRPGPVPEPVKPARRVGRGGAVTTVDPYASKIALGVLKRGGNATDAAVAAAAALGVTEPYSAGVGGGGYFVHYSARTGKVRTIDGRETAPAGIRRDAFIDPETGEPYNFTPELVTSGVAVGVPGTPATWARALRRWGTLPLRDVLRPAARLADRGFVVDQTFHDQTADNRRRFNAFTSTRRLFLRKGKPPRVGSTLRNRDLAALYRLLGRKGMQAFYTGPVAGDIARTVRRPPRTTWTRLPIKPGSMTRKDLAGYQARNQLPTRSKYRGLTVHGMAPGSSGGTTVGEALNIMERYDIGGIRPGAALHHYLEASALAFADRSEYLGDPAYTDVPVKDLLSDTFAAERACAIDSDTAMTKPTTPGDADEYDGQCSGPAGRQAPAEDNENISTTNLTVADRWGNVVEYTLTIEQTGGSGMVVPGRGFLLNNELTDFSLEYDRTDPNRIQPGKRPRSSMSPTIVLKNGKPYLALGSPGGSTIITTVLQILMNRVDRGVPLLRSVAAPRASQRNTATVTSEPAFIDKWDGVLSGYGHELVPAGDAFTSEAEIGAATAIEFGPRGRMTVVAEPERRGGGAARVVRPHRP